MVSIILFGGLIAVNWSGCFMQSKNCFILILTIASEQPALWNLSVDVPVPQKRFSVTDISSILVYFLFIAET